MTTGIYALYWELPDLIYIGQSINIKNRYSDHLSLLSRQIHYNRKIQETYNNYGQPSIHILKESRCEDLDTLEQLYIDEFNSVKDGLNIAVGPVSTLRGTKNSTSIYSEELLEEIFEELYKDILSIRDISRKLKVNESTIYGIASGDRHIWLHERFPDMWDSIKSKLGSRKARGNNSAKKQGRTYPKVKDPNGNIFTIECTTEFCKQHGLDCQALYRLFKGKVKTHKEWRLYEGTM